MHPTFYDYETLRLQQMTVEQKFAVLEALRQRAIALTEAGIRMRNPGWSAEQVVEEARRIRLHPNA